MLVVVTIDEFGVGFTVEVVVVVVASGGGDGDGELLENRLKLEEGFEGAALEPVRLSFEGRMTRWNV